MFTHHPQLKTIHQAGYLGDAQTMAELTSGSSETGHSGNGYCRITVIECKNTALYTRINNSMKGYCILFQIK